MRNILTILVLIGFLGIGACATANQEQGAATGAIIGSGAGAIIGHQFGKRDAGALLGAALGGATGLFYGQGQDSMQNNRGGRSATAPNDDFRNPYKQPDQKYCNGQWAWDARSAYWLCR